MSRQLFCSSRPFCQCICDQQRNTPGSMGIVFSSSTTTWEDPRADDEYSAKERNNQDCLGPKNWYLRPTIKLRVHKSGLLAMHVTSIYCDGLYFIGQSHYFNTNYHTCRYLDGLCTHRRARCLTREPKMMEPRKTVIGSNIRLGTWNLRANVSQGLARLMTGLLLWFDTCWKNLPKRRHLLGFSGRSFIIARCTGFGLAGKFGKEPSL